MLCDECGQEIKGEPAEIAAYHPKAGRLERFRYHPESCYQRALSLIPSMKLDQLGPQLIQRAR